MFEWNDSYFYFYFFIFLFYRLRVHRFESTFDTFQRLKMNQLETKMKDTLQGKNHTNNSETSTINSFLSRRKRMPPIQNLPKGWIRQMHEKRWCYRHIPTNFLVSRTRIMSRMLEILSNNTTGVGVGVGVGVSVGNSHDVTKQELLNANLKAKAEDQMEYYMHRQKIMELQINSNEIDDIGNSCLFVKSKLPPMKLDGTFTNKTISMLQNTKQEKLPPGWKRSKGYFEHLNSGLKIYEIHLMPTIFDILRQNHEMDVNIAYDQALKALDEERTLWNWNENKIHDPKYTTNNFDINNSIFPYKNTSHSIETNANANANAKDKDKTRARARASAKTEYEKQKVSKKRKKTCQGNKKSKKQKRKK